MPRRSSRLRPAGSGPASSAPFVYHPQRAQDVILHDAPAVLALHARQRRAVPTVALVIPHEIEHVSGQLLDRLGDERVGRVGLHASRSFCATITRSSMVLPVAKLTQFGNGL